MKGRRRFRLSTTHIILLSFLVTVLCGSLLLALPVSSSSGRPVPYVDALFTATSATCVTGLVVVQTSAAWSPFGQVILLLLIQIGGLGLITILSALTVFLNRKMGLADRLLLQDAFNLNTLSGLSGFVRKVVIGTAIVEGIGALAYLPVFVPEFGARGIWISVFNSVSAFCNAGLDIIGADSLCPYVRHPLVNLVTCALIILGGLGYIVWWDVLRVLRLKRPDGAAGRLRRFRLLTLHSKIALCSTAALILFGGLAILLCEYRNPATIGNLPLAEKIAASFFQSVTTRTAGFATLNQAKLTNASVFVCLLLMFIGGSPVGTAGGIKTVTAAALGAAALSAVRRRDEVTIFGRTLPRQTIGKATAVASMSALIVFVSTVLLAVTLRDVQEADAISVIYETVSATATVGLSRGVTNLLGRAGKLILTATMYLGRVGPISLAVAFNFMKAETQNLIRNPSQEISVG